MEVHLSADKEARLRDFAARTGRDASALVEEAIERMLQLDAQFLEAVEEGRADVRRGAMLDQAEVVDRIERILRP
jgi:predicted transcriptional regulator